MIEKRKGNEHFVKSKFGEAIAHYTNALDLVADVKGFDPKQRSILYANRAECLIRLKRYSEAVPSCDDAVRYDASNIKARFRRAKANEKMGRYKESLKDLQFVIKRDSSNRKVSRYHDLSFSVLPISPSIAMLIMLFFKVRKSGNTVFLRIDSKSNVDIQVIERTLSLIECE